MNAPCSGRVETTPLTCRDPRKTAWSDFAPCGTCRNQAGNLIVCLNKEVSSVSLHISAVQLCKFDTNALDLTNTLRIASELCRSNGRSAPRYDDFFG
jgi:hypothetical protein